jgi:hypothetical protein
MIGGARRSSSRCSYLLCARVSNGRPVDYKVERDSSSSYHHSFSAHANTMRIIVNVLLAIGIVCAFAASTCRANVSCMRCSSLSVNPLTDTDLNTDGCTSVDSALCTLILRIDYAAPNKSFAIIDGSDEKQLILSNGEPQSNQVTFVWFTEVHVERFVNIICFSGTSCGVDLIKKIYKEDCNTNDVTERVEFIRLSVFLVQFVRSTRPTFKSSCPIGSTHRLQIPPI